MKYSIDTSAILDGWRRYYPPDVMPAFWERVDILIDSGHLRATEEVLIELKKKDDAVHAWAKDRPKLFVPLDEEIQLRVASLLSAHRKLIDTRKNRSGADPFVIALAHSNSCTVITGESPSNSQKRPRIPDVCRALSIPTMPLIELMRTEGWRWNL